MSEDTRRPFHRTTTGRVLILAVAALLFAFAAERFLGALGRGLRPGPGETTVTHAVAVERVRAVAKLVASETTLRDVVTYRNTRLGSTKKALVVVTGRVMAGFDLEKGMRVEVDDSTRTIVITLPPARILSVDIRDIHTYDEDSGLWNRFRGSDRDRIFDLARARIVRTARNLGVEQHAARSAVPLLQTLFRADGYTTRVRIAAPPTREPPG